MGSWQMSDLQSTPSIKLVERTKTTARVFVACRHLLTFVTPMAKLCLEFYPSTEAMCLSFYK
jgi:hypothetical protein